MSANRSDALKATVIYNPFDMSDRADAELVFQEGKPVSHYIDGLPGHVEWSVSLNTTVLRNDVLHLVFPKPGDHIVVVPVPEGGGDDGKAVLALVATLALSAFAPVLGGHIGMALVGSSTGMTATIASAAVSIAGGLLINALIPAPDTASGSDAASYGIDGPKNTSTEGIPVPVLYGRHGIGGNLIDLYTENKTDENGKSIQYLYGRVAVSEGPIKSISGIKINGQSIESFEDVEIDMRLGNDEQAESEWFSETVSLFSQGRDLDTDYIGYTTTSEIDRLRLDLMAPLGLYRVSGSGKRKAVSVGVDARYRKLGDVDWIPFLNNQGWKINSDAFTALEIEEASTAFKVLVKTRKSRSEEANPSSTFDVTLQYRKKTVGDTESWIAAETQTVSRYDSDLTWVVDSLESAIWEFQLVTVGNEWSAEIGTIWHQNPVPIVISDKSTAPVRRTYETLPIPEGRYEIEIRRTAAEGDPENSYYDKIQISDIGEIVTDKVMLPYTAWLGYKIRLSGQLNAIPQITAVAEGRIMPIYDHNGVNTGEAYSNNPADIALDIYLNTRYGAQTEKSRIDFAAYAEWRDHCTEKGLTFNALFYEMSNIDDALKHVYAAGHAQRVTSGAKISVAIDRETMPSFMFDDGNMKKGSFSITYLPSEERINDLEITYLDENDDYKQHSARVTNKEAIARGEALKTSTINLKGVTSYERALREGTFRMNYNRLVSRVAEWESPTEAIGCTVGDMVIVQHEMPGWGNGGRILGGIDSSLTLDKPVTMEPGKAYRVLVHQDMAKIHDATVTAQSANLVTVNVVVAEDETVRRLVIGGEEYAITRVMRGLSSTDLLLEATAGGVDMNGQIVELWNADSIDDVGVTNPADTSGLVETVSELSLAEPLPSGSPKIYANYIFGELQFSKKPFRVKSIGRDADGLCKISAIEYVPEVYDDTPDAQPHNFSSLVDYNHVVNLATEEVYDAVSGAIGALSVEVSWAPGVAGNYFGAEVFVSVNGSDYISKGVTSALQMNIGSYDTDSVLNIKVVARTADFASSAAVFETAPLIQHTVVNDTGEPELPVVVSATKTLTPDTGDFRIDVELQESASDTFKLFRIEVETPDAARRYVKDVYGNSFSLQSGSVAFGFYTVYIKTLDVFGQVSDEVSTQILLQKDDLLPGDVQVFTFNPASGRANLEWEAASGPVSHYRIRHAYADISWNSAADVAGNIAGLSYTMPALDGFYYVKAVSRYGFESKNAKVISNTGTWINGLNVVAELDDGAQGYPGAKTDNLTVLDGQLKMISPVPIQQWTTLEEVDKMAYFGLSGLNSASYTFDTTLDLGAVYTSRISFDVRAYGWLLNNVIKEWFSLEGVETLSGADASQWDSFVEYRSTNIDPSLPEGWGNWTDLRVGDYSARAYQFRIRLEGLASGILMDVTQAVIFVDMPDRVEGQADVICPSGGIAVSFPVPFREKPAIAITAQSVESGVYGVTTNVTKSGFTQQFFDKNDQPYACTFDWVAKGYGYEV